MENTINKSSKFWNNIGKFFRREYLRIISLIFILLFSIIPVFSIFFKIKGNDFSYVFKDSGFGQAIINSIIYSLSSTIIAMVLATISAYLLNRAAIRFKKVYISVLTLSMLVPTLSIGLGVKMLFGTGGYLQQWFGINTENTGMIPLIVGSVIFAFPTLFLIIYDSLQYEDKRPYDAANILGIKQFSTFFRVTLPYLKTPLISAFFTGFSLIFADYGIPMEIAGKTKTLPMYLYEQVMSTFQYGRASIVAVFLLMPAVISFILDLMVKGNSGEEASPLNIHNGKAFNIFTIVFTVILSLILFLPQFSFIFTSFVTSFPTNMTLTVTHFTKLGSLVYGVGVGNYIWNSILMSLLTALVGTFFSFFFAYEAVRMEGVLGKIINFLSKLSLAIPGLVLGMGFIFIFKSTRGWFYSTMLILIVVNVVHLFGSPYTMAKNCLEKMNNDYEIAGETLGISRFSIFLKVIVPNSLSTLMEMFSYYFLNTMVTISAVAFLCTYKNQPLSILITTFEKNGKIEIQAAISTIIFAINIIFKGSFIYLTHAINKHKIKRMEDDEYMPLTRYQFDILTFLEKKGKGKYSQRYLADLLTFSVGTVNKVLGELNSLGYTQIDCEGELSLSDAGLEALEPYKVKRAIIMAAGFGSRMAPVTLDTPKPLVKVNGKRIIDTLLDALYEKDIKDIIIITGYKKEQFYQLLEKYPTIKFVDNPDYNKENNISSMMKVIDYIDRCYICEADLLVSNNDLILKYQYTSNYLGAKVVQTDDWCFKKSGGYISKYQMGGEDCYQAFGISYWNLEDSKKLREDLPKVYKGRAGKEKFWESAALTVYKKDFKIEIRKCHKTDIVEIDNFWELVSIDPSYANYHDHDKW